MQQPWTNPYTAYVPSIPTSVQVGPSVTELCLPTKTPNDSKEFHNILNAMTQNLVKINQEREELLNLLASMKSAHQEAVQAILKVVREAEQDKELVRCYYYYYF